MLIHDKGKYFYGFLLNLQNHFFLMKKNTLFFAYHYTPFICISIMLLLSFDAKSYTRRAISL